MNKNIYNLLKDEYYKKRYDQLEETAIDYHDDSNDLSD
mgnify:CR=1 FL=1